MDHSNKSTLLRRRRALLGTMRELDGAIAGSFFQREMGGHRRYCLARMLEGRQRQCYVSEAHAVAVREGVRQYGRLVQLVRELSEVNLALIRIGVQTANERRTSGDPKTPSGGP